MDTVGRILDTIAEEAARADRTDGQLLDLFVRLRDEDAFAAVVRRHGPMVLGVCRRVLRNAADADDAFQAAFLVLARKAATIGTRHLLAQWLHGVAYNTARKLRQSNARRATRERPLAEAAEPHAPAPESRDGLLAILDEELARLPDRYRAVLVLCDLQGLTRREAAQALACPEGTVGGRLARARDLLASRLAARGVVPAAALLGAVLAESAALAVPPEATAAVVRAVGVDDLAGAAAKGLISRRVADTTEGVLKSMFATKLRALAAVAACCALALACTVGAIHLANAQPAEPDNPAPKVVREKVPPDAEKKLLSAIPLKKLDAKSTAERLAKLLPEAVTVAAARDENTLLVYATARGTEDVRLALRTLGEELPKEADKAFAETWAKLPKPEPKKYTFEFRNTKWDDVLDWYAKESGLTLVTTVKPTGTVTIGSPQERRYTFADITDLINEALAQQKLMLVRGKLTFFLHPADERLDPTKLSRVELSELKNWGKTELVEVTIPLQGLNAAEAKPELEKLLTPFGSIAALRGKVIVVRDTAGNIERILKILEAVEKLGTPLTDLKPAVGEPVLKTYTLTKLKAEDVAAEVQKAFAGRRVQVITLPQQKQIMVLASPEEHARIVKLIRDLEDKPPAPGKPVPKRYTMSFQKAKWEDVLQWYSNATDLPLFTKELPKGTFSTAPQGEQPATLAEVTDRLNEALAVQGYILIRGEKSIAVVPTDKKIDWSLAPLVTPAELERRGQTELVRVQIRPDKVSIEDFAQDVEKRLTRLGKVEELYGAGAVEVRDRAGNIRSILERAADPPARPEEGDSLTSRLHHKKAGEVAEVLVTLLADKAGGIRTAPLVSITVDEQTNSVTIKGPPDKIALARRLIEALDQPAKPDDPPTPPVKPAGAAKKYTIKFDKTPWKDVFTWYATESGLTRVGDVGPTGAFTFVPAAGKEFTLAEITDLINDALMAQQWIMVRSDKSFYLHPADEKIDPKWVPRVKPDELDKRGRTELVEIVLLPAGAAAADVAADVRKLTGPFGQVIAGDKFNVLLVRDTAGNLRRIMKVLDDIEQGKRP